MKIRPKIPIYLGGNTILAPLWYIDRYGGRTSLQGWNLNKRYNYANNNLNLNDHRNAGDLNTVYRKNFEYTQTPEAIKQDIQSFYDSDGNGMSAEDFVNFYNLKASEIRNHWNQNQTYNASTAGSHNRLYRRMFQNRSNLAATPGSGYNIGYQEGKTKGGYNIEDIEGSSTWLRRMDLYEKEFDPNNPDSNRLHEITLKDGTKATVYKKANGDIGLLKSPNTPPSLTPTDPNKSDAEKLNRIPVGEKLDPESPWSKLNARIKNVAPDLLDALRLAGNMYNNDRVFNESLKAIRPNLQQTYNTYRQVVGDEATKLAYYRRGAEGVTRASKPITSDMDRQMAYLNEAYKNKNELEAQGDLADNQRIRETSAESAAHADANTERATAVANSNITELNKAAAAKHQLQALKYSADWTNIEQYLLGKLAEWLLEQAKLKAILDLIDVLTMLDAIYDDPGYKNAYNNLLTITLKYKTKDGDTDWNHPEVMKASRALLKAKNQYLINYYKTKSAKSGTKLTYKDNTDKYLYKVSRDVVEHFRKMSKMTDESRIKTLPKAIKLSSSPKAKKMLLGGVAPFTVYRPLGIGGESAVSTQISDSSSSKSSKDTAAKDKLDMVKKLFESVKGLPIDVATVYKDIQNTLNKAKAFGEELSSDDIASMYLNSMLKMANLKYSEDVFEKAKAQATSNEALNEYAVGTRGEMVLLDLETGKIRTGTIADWKKSNGKLNPLTNDQLLNMRAHSPNMAFDDNILNIVNNGVGMNKIAKQIKELAATLGSQELKIEGISEVQGNKIKAGLRILAGTDGTPDGFYKVTNDTKDSSDNVKLALNYIYSMLPNNYRTILELHSEGKGKELVANFLMSQTSDYIKLDISPLTGKASSSESSSGKGGNITPAVALSMGLGERETFVIADKTSDGLKVSAVNLPILDANHNPLAVATLQLVGNGDYAGQLQLNSATMGGVKISPEGINNILISEGRIHAAELPVDKLALLQGIIKPDLNFLKNIEKADLQIRDAGITNRDNLTPELVNIINDIYSKNGLPMIYSMGTNGPVLTSEYRRFAMMKATAPQEAFEEDLTFNDGVIEASEDDRNRFESMMKQVTGNSKYSLDNGISVPFFGRLTGTDLYKGTIYIPMSESHISALASTGFTASPEKYNEIDALDLQALFIRSSGYKSPGSWTK